MRRPPCLPSILIAASCLLFFSETAFAQPAWDLAEDENGNSAPSSSSTSSVGTDDETPPDVPRVERAAGPRAPAEAGWNGASSDEEAELDERLALMADRLKKVQRSWRAYSAGWITLQGGLIGLYGWLASESDGGARAAHLGRAVVAGLNWARMLITPQPAWGAYKKFSKMPSSTLNEKRAKWDAGLHVLGDQLALDRKSTSPEAHILVGLAAISVGAAVLFGFDDGARAAVETTLGIVLVGEMQFATRPYRTKKFMTELSLLGKIPEQPKVEFSFAPLITNTGGRGVSLMGRF